MPIQRGTTPSNLQRWPMREVKCLRPHGDQRNAGVRDTCNAAGRREQEVALALADATDDYVVHVLGRSGEECNALCLPNVKLMCTEWRLSFSRLQSM